jgi:hypothetical protein
MQKPRVGLILWHPFVLVVVTGIDDLFAAFRGIIICLIWSTLEDWVFLFIYIGM